MARPSRAKKPPADGAAEPPASQLLPSLPSRTPNTTPRQIKVEKPRAEGGPATPASLLFSSSPSGIPTTTPRPAKAKKPRIKALAELPDQQQASSSPQQDSTTSTFFEDALMYRSDLDEKEGVERERQKKEREMEKWQKKKKEHDQQASPNSAGSSGDAEERAKDEVLKGVSTAMNPKTTRCKSKVKVEEEDEVTKPLSRELSSDQRKPSARKRKRESPVTKEEVVEEADDEAEDDEGADDEDAVVKAEDDEDAVIKIEEDDDETVVEEADDEGEDDVVGEDNKEEKELGIGMPIRVTRSITRRLLAESQAAYSASKSTLTVARQMTKRQK